MSTPDTPDKLYTALYNAQELIATYMEEYPQRVYFSRIGDIDEFGKDLCVLAMYIDNCKKHLEKAHGEYNLPKGGHPINVCMFRSTPEDENEKPNT